MANQANLPAVSAVASAVAEFFNPSEVETIEQLGRDFQMAEDAKAKAEKSLASCDVALFDLVKGLEYAPFMKMREHFVTGCRDKGSPSDEAASKVWERAINRIKATCGFERPKAESKDAKRMSEKAQKRKAELEAMTELELEAQRTELIEKGDSKSLRVAGELAKEIEARAKPEIDKLKAEAKQLADALRKRIGELAKAGTPDAVDILTRMIQVSK